MSGNVRDRLVDGVMLQPEFTWLTNAVTPDGGVETGGVQLRGFQLAPECTPFHPTHPGKRLKWRAGAGCTQHSAESTGGTKQSPAPGTVFVTSVGEAAERARVAATISSDPHDNPR